MECTWTATHDDMPGSNKTLRINGTCDAPGPNYSFRIEVGNQGINPSIENYRLDLVVTTPAGTHPTVITPTKVEEFTQDIAHEYKTVSIKHPGEGAGSDSVDIDHLQ